MAIGTGIGTGEGARIGAEDFRCRCSVPCRVNLRTHLHRVRGFTQRWCIDANVQPAPLYLFLFRVLSWRSLDANRGRSLA